MAAFEHPSFRLYALARLLLVSGGQFISVALGWQILQLTRDPLQLGFIGLAQFVPIVAFSFFSGWTPRPSLAWVLRTVGARHFDATRSSPRPRKPRSRAY